MKNFRKHFLQHSRMRTATMKSSLPITFLSHLFAPTTFYHLLVKHGSSTYPERISWNRLTGTLNGTEKRQMQCYPEQARWRESYSITPLALNSKKDLQSR